MCLTPARIPSDKAPYYVNVACRHCRMCRDNRVNDLVGRCIAEQSTASKTYAVTLTYGNGDTPQAAMLRYSDVQIFLKRLRNNGYKVRYICAGEYGTRKGRAHWHIILFFYGHSPEWQINSRVLISQWEHGFCYFQNPDYRGFRYAIKYALKSDADGSVKALSMSKKPPLGYSFFMDMADDMVLQGLSIHSPEYRFAHVLDKNGLARKYWLQGRMRELFLERYCEKWLQKYGKMPLYTDFLYERYLDKIAKKEIESDPEIFERDKRNRDAAYSSKIDADRKAAFDKLPLHMGTLYLVTLCV